jgi:hypothetical protein
MAGLGKIGNPSRFGGAFAVGKLSGFEWLLPVELRSNSG